MFDKYPRLKVIVGHMGELIPYTLQRLNVALTLGNWLLANQEAKTAGLARHSGMQQSVYYYLRENVFITTSGVFDQAAFSCALAEVGIEHLLFSVDDPFGDNVEAMEFLKATHLSPQEREQLAHGNAERLLNLISGAHPRRGAHPSVVSRLRSSLFAFQARAKSKIARGLLSFLVK